MSLNNETIGISAEVAIAKSFNIYINPLYESRADNKVVKLFIKNKCLIDIFDKEKIPKPIKHIAEGQNPIDFILEDNKSLSVKTNQKELGKVAPQNIGQPTAETYFEYYKKYFKGFDLTKMLKEKGWEDNYISRSKIFKENSINNIDKLVSMYWENLFDCDYYIHFFNIAKYLDVAKNYILLGKENSPLWEKDKFSFTQSLKTWNESNTLKYCGISIGEFQVHSNRNCFKFRFNMKGIMDLYRKNLI